MNYIKKLSAVLFSIALLCSCKQARIESVVLITVDGLSKEDAAKITSIHSKASVFTNAVTPSPVLMPALASILTGLHPVGHGVLGNESWMLGENAPTIGKVFQANNMRTAAFVGTSEPGPISGFEQGFDKYSFDFKSIPAGAFYYIDYEKASSVTENAVNWIGNFGDKPFFIWVHYGDLNDDWVYPIESAEKEKRLAAISSAIDKLLFSLPQNGANTLIVLTSPASDSKNAHGEIGHGTFVYNSTVSVPLDIVVPGITPKNFDAPVSLEDVYATILELKGFKSEEAQGVSLAPLIKGGVAPNKDRARLIINNDPLYRWGAHPLEAVIAGNMKLIVAAEDSKSLFDLAADPDEKNAVSGAKPDVVISMNAKIAELKNKYKKDKPVGFLSPVGAVPKSEGTPAVDKMLEAISLFGKAAVLHRSKAAEEAYADLEKAAAIAPDNKRFSMALAMIGEFVKTKPEAAQLWENAARLNPTDPIVMSSLAQIRYEIGDMDGALAAVEKSLESGQENPEARMLAAKIVIQKAQNLTGDAKKDMLQKALGHLIAVVQTEETPAPMLLFQIGNVALDIAQLIESAPLDMDVKEMEKRKNMVEQYRRAAQRGFGGAKEIDPKYPETYFGLGRLDLSMGKKDEAKKNLETYLSMSPEGEYAAQAKELLETIR